MTDAQSWTLIGGFFALVLAQTAFLLRVVKTKTGRITERLDALDRMVERLNDEHFGRHSTSAGAERWSSSASSTGHGTAVDDLDAL